MRGRDSWQSQNRQMEGYGDRRSCQHRQLLPHLLANKLIHSQPGHEQPLGQAQAGLCPASIIVGEDTISCSHPWGYELRSILARVWG